MSNSGVSRTLRESGAFPLSGVPSPCRFTCGLRYCLLEHAATQHVKFGPSLHTALDVLEAIHLSLYLPLAPDQLAACANCRIVASNPVGKRRQFAHSRGTSVFKPDIELVGASFAHQRKEGLNRFLCRRNRGAAMEEFRDVGRFLRVQIGFWVQEEPGDGAWGSSYRRRYGLGGDVLVRIGTRVARPGSPPPSQQGVHGRFAAALALLADLPYELLFVLLTRVPAFAQIGCNVAQHRVLPLVGGRIRITSHMKQAPNGVVPHVECGVRPRSHA